MSIQVISPGPRTMVQDFGRFGYQSSGFASSGVMDREAMRRANLLVNNDDDEAVLEFCLVGPIFHFENEANIAVSGGDFIVRVGARTLKSDTSIKVYKGEMVTIMPGSQGTFGVIAIGGGLDIPTVMGSKSTNAKCKVGGYKGRALEKGDVLELRRPGFGHQWHTWRTLPDRKLPTMDEVTEIRVIPGPQDDLFTEAGTKTFYTETYEVTPQSDRMGFRLSGPFVETKNGSDIISDGIAFGSIQIPGNGMPIVMMADRQTTGGYAKIATVAGIDLPLFAQLRPGMKVRFAPITVQEAGRLYRENEILWQKTRASMVGPLFDPDWKNRR